MKPQTQLKTTTRQAAELASVQKTLANLEWFEEMARIKLKRLSRVVRLPDRPMVLDLGASSGSGIVGWQRAGCDCVGVEPFAEALANARIVSEKLGIPICIKEGVAEKLPFAEESFDLVSAQSVMEHVDDINQVVSEVYRVLRPSGVFYFNCASAMCPRQDEIDGFPLFGWYPNRVKLRIMDWAKVHRPALVGYTEHPAINWLTTRQARKMLIQHGFRRIWDRWDLRCLDEGGRVYGMLLRTIRCSRLTKFMADVLVSDSGWAAMK